MPQDSMKAFDACSLSLQSAKDPVVTPEGVLYSKEALLEALVQQKKDKQKRYKEWQAKQRDDAKEKEGKEQREKQKRLAEFHKQNHGGGAPSGSWKTLSPFT